MTPGNLLLAVSEVAPLLKSLGYIDAAGNFDEAKFQDVASDTQLASGVLAILTKYGVTIPANLTKLVGALPSIVTALPLLEQIVLAFK